MGSPGTGRVVVDVGVFAGDNEEEDVNASWTKAVHVIRWLAWE